MFVRVRVLVRVRLQCNLSHTYSRTVLLDSQRDAEDDSSSSDDNGGSAHRMLPSAALMGVARGGAFDGDNMTIEQAAALRQQAEQNRAFIAAAEVRRMARRVSMLHAIFPYLSEAELSLALQLCDDDDVRSLLFKRCSAVFFCARFFNFRLHAHARALHTRNTHVSN